MMVAFWATSAWAICFKRTSGESVVAQELSESFPYTVTSRVSSASEPKRVTTNCSQVPSAGVPSRLRAADAKASAATAESVRIRLVSRMVLLLTRRHLEALDAANAVLALVEQADGPVNAAQVLRSRFHLSAVERVVHVGTVCTGELDGANAIVSIEAHNVDTGAVVSAVARVFRRGDNLGRLVRLQANVNQRDSVESIPSVIVCVGHGGVEFQAAKYAPKPKMDSLVAQNCGCAIGVFDGLVKRVE